MPRIEIIPDGWTNSDNAKRGDGTPTIDVCRGCAHLFEEGTAAPIYLVKHYPKAASVGSTDVAHPPYDNGGGGDEFLALYTCNCCGKDLGGADS